MSHKERVEKNYPAVMTAFFVFFITKKSKKKSNIHVQSNFAHKKADTDESKETSAFSTQHTQQLILSGVTLSGITFSQRLRSQCTCVWYDKDRKPESYS